MTRPRTADDLPALRRQAASHLRLGTATGWPGSVVGASALSRLYDLACDPERAGEAITFLHELQVHQVVLHLQREQLVTEMQRVAAQRAWLERLFFEAPYGYLAADDGGNVRALNHRGAQLLGLPLAGTVPGPMAALLARDSGPVLRRALSRLQAGAGPLRVSLRASHGGLPLDAMLGRSQGVVLMAFTDDV